MLNQSDLQFLQGKIQELKNALFFSQNTSLLRMVTMIVSVLKVDDLGQMWFLVPRPQQAIQEFDREFPVRLEFFRKGKEFFLHVSGMAFIVTDPEEINGFVLEDMREQADHQMVLIKVKMQKADYFQSARPAQPRWWRELLSLLHGWAFTTRRGYKPYYLVEGSNPMLSQG